MKRKSTGLFGEDSWSEPRRKGLQDASEECVTNFEDRDEKASEPDLSASKKRGRSPQDSVSSVSVEEIQSYLDLVAKSFEVSQRKGKQAQVELTLLKENNAKLAEDLVLLQNELAGAKKNLIHVRGELIAEKNQAVSLKGLLDIQKRHSAHLQYLWEGAKESCKAFADTIKNLQTQIQALQSKFHEAEIKIEDQTKNTLCTICLERPRNVLCLPCMHLLFCIPCLEQHMKNCKTCPTCSVSIKGTLQCYGLA